MLSGSMGLAPVALVGILVLCCTAEVFVWSGPTTNILDPANWASGSVPSANSSMVIPSWVDSFVNAECSGGSACASGLVSMLPFGPKKAISLTVSEIILPKQGSIELGDQAQITLVANDNPTLAVWVTRNSTWQSFSCPQNWVIYNTTSNPQFRYPCFNDTAIFPAGQRYAVDVPANTYVANVTAFDDVLADRSQFTRTIQRITSSTKCPKPYSALTGKQYCQYWCLSSCASLNPDAVSSLNQQLLQTQLLQNLTVASQAENKANYYSLLAAVNVSASYAVPLTLTREQPAEVLRTFIKSVQSTLVGAFSWSCTLFPLFTVTCNVKGTLAVSVAAGLCTRSGSTYTINQTVLDAQFGLISHSLLQAAVDEFTVSSAKRARTEGLIAATLAVPTRFLTELTASSTVFPSVTLASAIANSLLISPDLVKGVKFGTSTIAAQSYMTVYVYGTAKLASSDITDKLKSSPSLSVTLTPSNAMILLFVPADVAPVARSLVVNATVITNSALASSFPLAMTDQKNLYASIREFLSKKGASIATIANIDVFPSATNARRQSPDVTIALTVPSTVTNFTIPPDSFNSFSYQGIQSSVVSTALLMDLATLEQNLAASLEPFAIDDNTTAVMAIHQLQQAILANIGPSNSLSTMQYMLVNLNGSNVNGVPALTISQCQYFLLFANSTSAWNATLVSTLSSILPVASSGVVIPRVTCGPLGSGQLGDLDPAGFSLNLTLTALTVVFPAALTTPLVTGAVNVALQQAVLAAQTAVLANQSAAIILLIPTPPPSLDPSPSTASSSSSLLPIIAAAAGGGALILLIIVIVLLRRNRGPKNPKKRTSVKDHRSAGEVFANGASRTPGTLAFIRTKAPYQDSGAVFTNPAFTSESDVDTSFPNHNGGYLEGPGVQAPSYSRPIGGVSPMYGAPLPPIPGNGTLPPNTPLPPLPGNGTQPPFTPLPPLPTQGVLPPITPLPHSFASTPLPPLPGQGPPPVPTSARPGITGAPLPPIPGQSGYLAPIKPPLPSLDEPSFMMEKRPSLSLEPTASYASSTFSISQPASNAGTLVLGRSVQEEVIYSDGDDADGDLAALKELQLARTQSFQAHSMTFNPNHPTHSEESNVDTWSPSPHDSYGNQETINKHQSMTLGRPNPHKPPLALPASSYNEDPQPVYDDIDSAMDGAKFGVQESQPNYDSIDVETTITHHASMRQSRPSAHARPDLNQSESMSDPPPIAARTSTGSAHSVQPPPVMDMAPPIVPRNSSGPQQTQSYETVITHDPDVHGFGNNDNQAYSQGYNQEVIDNQGSNDTQGFNQEYSDTQGYNQRSNETQGFNQEYNDTQGYNQRSNETQGYNQEYNDTQGYNQGSNETQGYNQEYNDNQGYTDSQGYDSNYPATSEQLDGPHAQSLYEDTVLGAFATTSDDPSAGDTTEQATMYDAYDASVPDTSYQSNGYPYTSNDYPQSTYDAPALTVTDSNDMYGNQDIVNANSQYID